MEGGSPTLRRRRLGLALRELRERAGLTGEAAAAALDRSPSWISRVESGRVGVRARDLRDLFETYGLNDRAARAELEDLAQEGKRRGWWSRYAEALSESYAVYIGLEDEATSLSIYHNVAVPGLLQSEDYARAILSLALPPLASTILDARVDVRMARQRLLTKEPPLRVTAVIDEAVLYRAYGSHTILREQLGALVNAARLPSLDLRVVPFAQAQQVIVFGSFSIMNFAEDPPLVYIETLAGGLYGSGDTLQAHQQVFDRVLAAALGPEESIAAIERAQT